MTKSFFQSRVSGERREKMYNVDTTSIIYISIIGNIDAPKNELFRLCV